ncbi:hypothetical protein E4T43_01963 [Aureobasidium subglaciale]|nr:hypothetical protein E4T43_01963 [Aureobasidium subglaciale]
MNSFKAASVLSLFTTLAAAWPASPAWNSTSSSTGYACNPAHSYPGGASCISTAGSLTLVTPTAWTTSTTVYTTDYVTYCPTPTVVTINKQTITVTKATTLTVPCPTTAVITKPVLAGPTGTAPAPSATASGCVAKYNSCRTTRVNGLSANQAQCAADNAACQGACYTAYNTCRTTRVNGLSANQAQCASEYAGCLGENPFTEGYSTLPGAPASTVWTTSTTVYTTDYVTYCPTPTVVTINKQTITVTKATTLTVPCPTTAVVTKPVLVGPTASSAAPSMPAASKPAGSMPAASMPAASMPAASMPAASMPAASMPAVVCPPAQTVTVTQYVTVSMESPKAPVSAPATTQKPSSAPSASACATALFDGCNPARSSCPNGPGTFTTVTPSTYPTSYVINGQTVSFTAAPTSCLPSSSAAMSSKAASSAPASKPASSAPASSAPASKASSAVPAPSASAAGKCPLDLKAGAYEYPHALRVNGVNGYNIVVGKDSKTDVVFDIPQADAGKTCNTYFALPAKSGLVTSDYTLSGAGVITVSKGGKVVNTFTPQPNNAYLIESGKCASGQAVTYTFSTSDALTLSLFNDFNACALGAFVTVA